MLKDSPQDLVHDDHFNSLVPDVRVDRRGFIAGVIAAGFAVTVDVLGEEIRSAEESREIARSYHRLLARIESERLDANISVKLTALGLEHDDRLCHANLEAVVEDEPPHGEPLLGL